MSLLTNLVSYWKLDESSGDAADSVGSNTATNTSVTYAAAKINNGAVSNATTDRLYIGNPASLQIAGTQTFNFWIQGSSQGANSRSIISAGGINSAADGGIYFFHYTGQNLDFGVSNGSTLKVAALDVAATAALLDGSFHMVTLVFTASTKLEIFKDGVSVSSNTASIISTRQTNKNLSIFAIETDQSATRRDAFQGTIDEIGFWNKALSSAEITELYNGGAGNAYPFSITFDIAETITLIETSTNLRGLAFSIAETTTLIEAWTALKGISFTIAETIGLVEAYNFVRNRVFTIAETISLIEFPFTLLKKWTNTPKNNSTFTNTTKNSANMTATTKNASTWTNETKN